MNATMAGPWRIIHIAGHGAEPLVVGSRVNPRGVVLSDNTFIGPTEIGALRVIPELVFVNCCHLATGDVSQLLKETNYDRASFASGVAESLINKGVRCVVAAGWAVSDEAARVFATTFYAQLLDGSTFIDAVAAARQVARACGGNTWAAYQAPRRSRLEVPTRHGRRTAAHFARPVAGTRRDRVGCGTQY